MRIERLILERYGAFTDRVLELREDAQLHVVLGANEAGKTSALNAIGDLLFGFGHSTSYDFLHHQTTLRIGAQLRLADGSRLSFWRRKGTKNTLRDEADKPLGDDVLARALGSVTREVFFSEFGLTAEKLRAGGRELLRADGRLAETLAASSAQLSTLAHSRARLDAEADALFGARRASGKAFYIALDRHRDAEKRLRDAIVTADALREAESAVAEAEDKRAELGEKHNRLGRDLARRERALRTRPKLDRLQRLQEELASLSDLPPVDAETLALWRGALEQHARIEEELARQQIEELDGAAAIDALEVDESLLGVGAKIDALREKLGEMHKAEKDLPKRHESARGAREELNRLARRLGLDGHEALLAREPTDAALAHASELIDARGDAERRRAVAADALLAARRESQKQEQSAQKHGRCVDPAPFRRRLDVFADIPAEADRLRREAVAQERGRARLLEETQQLDPCAGAPDQLARLPLPDAAQIEAFRQRFEKLDAESKDADATLRGSRAALTSIEQDIVALQSEGEVATREGLATARNSREGAYLRLGAALDGEPAPRSEAFFALGVAIRKVDATTDVLLTGAERAARFEAACERRAKEQRVYERLAALQDEHVARWRKEQEEWGTLWARCGVAPKPPQAMAQWRRDVQAILQQRLRLDDSRVELDTLAQKLDAHRDALMGLAADMGESVDAALPIEAFYKHARAALDRMQAGWSEAHTALALFENSRETLARTEQNLAAVEAEVERLTAAWPGALAAIGFDQAASPAEAKAVLAIWRDAPVPRNTLESEQHRIDTMQGDIAAFETAVAALVAAAAPDLRERPPREALDLISARLKQSQTALAKRNALQEARESRESARTKLAQKLETAAGILVRARNALCLDAAVALAPTFERLRQRHERERERTEAERDLVESGDGHDEAALRAEQGDLDFDVLAAEVARLKIEREQLLGDVAAAATRLHDAIRARDELAAGRDAAGAASDKAEAGAELVGVAARWLRRAATARLAARAIERHRAAVQDPLLERASTLFAIATDGAFRALGVDFDEDDAPVLAGLRENGARVLVGGMSEGARDQLFLSLRLALLELRAAEPLPFIADDLLASFDDARTARALGLLAEFGRKRQAILFTHHQHVAEIAATLKGARVDTIAL